MSRIICRSCGKTYRTEKADTCPRCGAYNRPATRTIVDADGTVRTERKSKGVPPAKREIPFRWDKKSALSAIRKKADEIMHGDNFPLVLIAGFILLLMLASIVRGGW
jgi:uncharacterized OB-fold protein